MAKLRVLLGMLLLLVTVAPAHALVSYTFSGPGLEGTLLLDDSAPFVITHDPRDVGPEATLDSPLNFISGRFGAFTFSGRPELLVVPDERPDPLLGARNTWLVNASVTGPPVNGAAPTRVRLGFDGEAPVTIGLVPPQNPPGDLADSAFFGLFISSQDSALGAQPVTISGPFSVPEPAAAVLLILGLATVLILRRVSMTYRSRLDANGDSRWRVVGGCPVVWRRFPGAQLVECIAGCSLHRDPRAQRPACAGCDVTECSKPL